MTAVADDASLLATKLFVPPPRPNRVSRPRLREQLEAARGGTVTLAAAAAGSGKSTLLAEWALSAGKRVAWLSLDAADDDPCRFLNYVIAALKSAGALAGADAFASATSSSAAAVDAVLTEVLNAIAERQADVALVLDDYHAIESESVHRIVQSIIDHIPPNLHLVIASRIDPPLALSRLRARGMLLELRASELRFTTDEAAHFLNEAMGLALTAEQVAELEERTEGWAVGLQMAAISLRGRDGAASFISSFSGSNRYVLDYLTDEVLRRQPDDVRAFLLESSILTQLAAPLCDAVTGRGESDRILRQLDAANLFLIPLDDVRFWYRYHHLFGSLLRHELERSASAAQIAELHRRAAAWYASNAMPEQALHHAVAGHDDDGAVAVVAENGGAQIAAGHSGTVVRWMAQLPRERLDNDVDLLILHSRALMAEYQVERAMHEVTRAEANVRAKGETRYDGALLSLRGMLERLRGDAGRSVETMERAMTLLDRDDFWYSMNALHLGLSSLMITELDAAERYLGQATAALGRADGLLTAVFARSFGASISLWRGRPDEALRMAAEANEWIGDARSPLAALPVSVQAEVYQKWNDLDRAREFAERAVELSRKGALAGYAETARVLAAVAESQGEWDAALTAADEAVRAIRYSGNTGWADACRAIHFGIRWRRGDVEPVVRWCDESGLLDVGRWRERLQPGLLRDLSLTLGARVLLHQKRFDEAQRLIGALVDEAVRQRRVSAQVTLLILRSLAENGDAAVAAMQQALEIAAKPRFVRPFLDEGSAVLPILERAAARAADRDFALRVLSAFAVPVKLRPAMPGLTEPLSDREIEVLQIIAAGASNQAAARKLFVAPSTVKKHLENIYAKLGVGGRTQAVARARELRIL